MTTPDSAAPLSDWRFKLDNEFGVDPDADTVSYEAYMRLRAFARQAVGTIEEYRRAPAAGPGVDREALKVLLVATLVNVGRYPRWEDAERDAEEVLPAFLALLAPEGRKPATHDDIPACPKCGHDRTCFHCEHCGENF